MSFLNKHSFGSKPSLVKPILIVVAILLVIGGSYSLLGHKKDSADDSKKSADSNQAEQAEVQSSGLDQDMKVAKVEDVEKVIAKWVEANPKAIIASVNNMQKKAMEEQMHNAQKNIGAKKDELFKDKSSPNFSPSGYNITIVEFFDYSCGYCKKAQGTLEELLGEDKKIRVACRARGSKNGRVTCKYKTT